MQKVRQAIGSAHLPACEKNFLRALLEVVNWTTWSCPISETAEDGGVSMERLGMLCGYTGRRNAQRLRARTQAKGLVTVIHRGWMTNYYRLEVERILELGEQGAEARRQHLAERKAAKAARAAARRAARAAEDGPSIARPMPPAPPPAPVDRATEPAPAVPVPATLPAWAAPLAQTHTLPVATVVDVAERVLCGLYGAEAAARRMVSGDDPRRILRRWTQDGRPPLDAWSQDLAQDLAALAACEADPAHRLRSRGHLQSLKYLFRASRWPELRELAWAHRSGACRCRAYHPPPSPPRPAELLVLGRRTRVTDAPPTWRSWDEARATLQAQMATDEYRVWIEHLAYAGEEAGVAWIAAANRYIADYIVEHYGAVLADALGPVGLVYPGGG